MTVLITRNPARASIGLSGGRRVHASSDGKYIDVALTDEHGDFDLSPDELRLMVGTLRESLSPILEYIRRAGVKTLDNSTAAAIGLSLRAGLATWASEYEERT